jgi:hypothetical protein
MEAEALPESEFFSYLMPIEQFTRSNHPFEIKKAGYSDPAVF